MQSPTIHYVKLLKAHSDLKTLVRKVDLIDCKTPLQHLKLQAYILLSHAQIEEYLESIVSEVSLLAREKISSEGSITRAVMGMISAGLVDEVKQERSNRKILDKTMRDIADFSIQAYNGFRSIISSNNGITKKDQENLFFPIGLNPSKIDSATMSALDAFGQKRGGIAHKFIIEREDTLSAVNAELDTIFKGLKSYDEAACATLDEKMIVGD